MFQVPIFSTSHLCYADYANLHSADALLFDGEQM